MGLLGHIFLSSALFADEVIVVDSFSQDRTVEIAREMGAKVVTHEFEGYGQQKNYAATIAHGNWIFSLDADEVISDKLRQEILKITNNRKNGLFMVNRLTSFCGKEIRHGGWYPDWIIRLYPKSLATFTEPAVHEEVVPLDKTMSIEKLHGDLHHDSFPSVLSQVATNMKYAKLGALALHTKRKPLGTMQLVIRPLIKFIECYFLKLGFIDGQAGLIIAINAAHSQFMKYAIARTEKVENL